MSSCRVFVGNLPLDIREREIDDLFYKYGRIKDIDLKTPSRPPAYAFVVFDDHRDAEDAVRAKDGSLFDGYRLRVEMAKGERSSYRDDDRGGRRSGGGGGGGGRRTDYGVVVTGLPKSCSWQDLKDFMRKVGDVVFSDVDKYGDGVVEFSNREDMERAVDKMDGAEFKNPFDVSTITVKFANGKSSDSSRGRDSRRDDPPRRERSVSRSVSRSRSRSRSRERGGARGRDRDDDGDDDDYASRKRGIDEDEEAPKSSAAPEASAPAADDDEGRDN